MIYERTNLPPQTNLPSFPLEGVTFKAFLDFIESVGGRDEFYKTVVENEESSWWFCQCFSETKRVPMTTTDVCNMFLKELTVAKAQSYVEYLTEKNSPDVPYLCTPLV